MKIKATETSSTQSSIHIDEKPPFFAVIDRKMLLWLKWIYSNESLLKMCKWISISFIEFTIYCVAAWLHAEFEIDTHVFAVVAWNADFREKRYACTAILPPIRFHWHENGTALYHRVRISPAAWLQKDSNEKALFNCIEWKPKL